MQSVNDIIQGRNIQSEIALRETSGDLNRQQAANLRAVEPYLAREMLAKIDQQKEAAGASRASRIRSETLLPLEVKGEEAKTAHTQAQTNRITELLDYEKRNISANITQSLAAAGASNVNAERMRTLYPKEAQLLDNQNNEFVKLKLQGQEFTAKGLDVAKERDRVTKDMATAEATRQTKIREARKDAQTSLKMATDAEQNLMGKRPGGYADMKDASELAPDADLFHATSTKPYVYILENKPGFLYGSDTSMQKRDLPKVAGHQYTAQEVYDAANAEGRNMTVQQYMEQVFYPMLKLPVPWNTAVTSTLTK